MRFLGLDLQFSLFKLIMNASESCQTLVFHFDVYPSKKKRLSATFSFRELRHVGKKKVLGRNE